ncbi:MAG: 3-deoxy-manno-octulosonate cytidylyltransferase [Spartobacteria bacterium]|nr:3-deoxy-manno-octulosonate cytidylyltransferase [Spartobacteria bacterium]
MRTIGVIPSRWGSTRFPGKSLAPVAGKPLVQRVLEQARQAEVLDDVLVATDDERIAAVVREAGGKAVMTHPDHPSGTDRIAEAIRDEEADIVINIQGDEPLIEPALINGLGRALAEERHWDMATAATRITDEADVGNPAVVKVVWDTLYRALYFSRAPIPYVRDGTLSGAVAQGLFWRHIGIYAYRRDFLNRMVLEPPCAMEWAEKLEQLRALDLGANIKVLTTDAPGPGVDTPEDVARVEAIIHSTSTR